MKTKLAVLLSFFLSIAGAIYVDALDIRVDIDDIDQDEASAVDDLDDSLTSNRSGAIQSRRAGGKLSASSPRASRSLIGGSARLRPRAPERFLCWRLSENSPTTEQDCTETNL